MPRRRPLRRPPWLIPEALGPHRHRRSPTLRPSNPGGRPRGPRPGQAPTRALATPKTRPPAPAASTPRPIGTSQLAHNCTLLAWTDGRLSLALDPAAEQLRARGTEQRLREALEAALGVPVQLDLQVARPPEETPAQRRSREAQERQRRAEETLDHDPVVLRLREQLDAERSPGSVQPID